jgi:Phytochelatin synthase
MRPFSLLRIAVLVATACTASASRLPSAAEAKPKYGSGSTPLSLDHLYLSSHTAESFWHLIGYYERQPNDSACSLATATMLLNALLAQQPRGAETRLLTSARVLELAHDPAWLRRTTDGGGGVTLDQFARILADATAKIRHGTTVAVHHATESAEGRAIWRGELLKMSSGNYIVVNFIQGIVTGDTYVGHIALLGAFDETRNRVLVMDPDRDWYEPYWTDEATMYSAMLPMDKESGLTRGYITVAPATEVQHF